MTHQIEASCQIASLKLSSIARPVELYMQLSFGQSSNSIRKTLIDPYFSAYLCLNRAVFAEEILGIRRKPLSSLDY